MKKDLEKEFLDNYDQLSDPIFRYCYFKTGDRELAKDLLQEIFMKAWKYLAKGNDIENFKAFVYRLAHNMVVDWYRKKKTISLDQLAEGGFDPQDGSVDITHTVEFAHALSVMSKLEQSDQDLITWRYIDDMSPKEIAVILKERENTVSVRLHRAVERLKNILNHI